MTGRSSPTTWDFGDGSKATGPVVTHAYAKSGTYPVTLSVTDDSTTRTATVSDGLSVRVNEPPVAEAGADRRIAIGEETTFDAGASADADGTIVSVLLGLRRRQHRCRSGRAAQLQRAGDLHGHGSASTTARRSRTAATTTP